MTLFILPLLLILTPLVGAALLLLPIQEFKHERSPWGVAFLASLVSLGLAVAALIQTTTSDTTIGGSIAWLPSLGVSLALALDGVSVWLVLLVAAIGPVVVLASRGQIKGNPKPYYMFVLLLQAALMGTFVAADLIVFYIFFELTLIPAFFLIAAYGQPKAKAAATTYFIYAFTGSMLSFAAILYLGWWHQQVTGGWSFALADLINTAPQLINRPIDLDLGVIAFSTTASHLVLAGLLAGFLVKVPIWPLHHYLPLAHSQAPTHGAIDLAGLVLKLGPFAILKFAVPLCPAAAVDFAPTLGVLAILSILAMGLICWVMNDAKKLLAFSSVSHMGFVVLGLFAFDSEAIGATGAMFYIFAYTLSAGALFLLLGMLYKRVQTYRLDAVSGIAEQMPVWAVFTAFFVMASVGLPGLNGFVGELLTMVGTFNSPQGTLGPVFAGFAVVGVIVAAMYLLRMLGRIAFGDLKLPAGVSKLSDLDAREILVLAPLAVLCLVLGLMPQPVLNSMQDTCQAWTARAHVSADQKAESLKTQHATTALKQTTAQ